MAAASEIYFCEMVIHCSKQYKNKAGVAISTIPRVLWIRPNKNCLYVILSFDITSSWISGLLSEEDSQPYFPRKGSTGIRFYLIKSCLYILTWADAVHEPIFLRGCCVICLGVNPIILSGYTFRISWHFGGNSYWFGITQTGAFNCLQSCPPRMSWTIDCLLLQDPHTTEHCTY